MSGSGRRECAAPKVILEGFIRRLATPKPAGYKKINLLLNLSCDCKITIVNLVERTIKNHFDTSDVI